MDEEDRQRLEEVHVFLFGLPPGASENETTTAAKLRSIIKAWERLGWLTRMTIYGIPLLAATGGGIASILGWLQW